MLPACTRGREQNNRRRGGGPTMTRAVIYARYSSDLQSDASIEDQIRLCEARAQSDRADIVNRFTDHAISGASMMRPGIQMLMQEGAAGSFDVLYAEGLDRLSRDQEDVAGIFKRLTFAGVKIITLSEGEVSELHIGLKGTMNQLFLKDLAQKTHRGLRGRAEQGKVPSGLCYGYTVVKRLGPDGEPVRGEREINEEQAAIVRRIFEEYADGLSPRAIVAKLNDEGIPGPASKGWSPSTLNGNWRRGLGFLNNELYVGQLVWNKVRYVKNPDTGKHVTRINPESEWVRVDMPELRIIDQDVWDKVKARQSETRRKTTHFGQARRPTYLLSHLLKCGCCGGGVAKKSATHYACSAAYEKGGSVCDNRRSIRQDDLEETVLQAIRDQLMDPALVEVFCEEYTAHLNRLRMEKNAARAGYEAELTRLAKRERRMIDAICEGFASPQLKADMDALLDRRKELNELLDTTEEAPVLLHPNMAMEYRTQVANIVSGLKSDKTQRQAKETIRSLIDRVVLHPDPNGDGLLIDLHGDLAGIMRIAKNRDASAPSCEADAQSIRLFLNTETKGDVRRGTMVGGTGLEPVTPAM
ncbi:MAG: recombinase family protein [Pseudomonadota bacterium]